MPFPIETERLRLRAYRESDFETFFRWVSDPRVTQYLLWGPRSPEEAHESLELRLHSAKVPIEGSALFCAVEKKGSETLVGEVLLKLRSQEHRGGEIGFLFDPRHHGNGYATEASKALLAFGFSLLGLHRIEGRLDARNSASARVMDRLGMRKEAHFVRNEFLQGRWTDEIVYAILDDEFAALNGSDTTS